MRLTLRRWQTSTKRGPRFHLQATLNLTQDEQQLITHYQLAGEVVAHGQMTVGLISKTTVPIRITVFHLLQSYTQELEDVAGLIEIEEIIRSSCATLVELLNVARTFGGEEVVEYTLDEHDDTRTEGGSSPPGPATGPGPVRPPPPGSLPSPPAVGRTVSVVRKTSDTL